MPGFNQTKALEAAAQRLAKHGGLDFANVRMVDHYLGRVKRPNPIVTGLVAEADAIVRPLLDQIADTEAECDLLRHRLRTCRSAARNLAEFVQALPARLPSHLDQEWGGVEVAAWLRDQIAQAPSAPTTEEPRP